MGLFAADKRNATVLSKKTKISDVTFSIWLLFTCKHSVLCSSAFNLSNTLKPSRGRIVETSNELSSHEKAAWVTRRFWRLWHRLRSPFKSLSHYPVEFGLNCWHLFLEHVFLAHMERSRACAALHFFLNVQSLCTWLLADVGTVCHSWRIRKLSNSNTPKICY